MEPTVRFSATDEAKRSFGRCIDGLFRRALLQPGITPEVFYPVFSSFPVAAPVLALLGRLHI